LKLSNADCRQKKVGEEIEGKLYADWATDVEPSDIIDEHAQYRRVVHPKMMITCDRGEGGEGECHV
jgi:hypothetical protein